MTPGDCRAGLGPGLIACACRWALTGGDYGNREITLPVRSTFARLSLWALRVPAGESSQTWHVL